MNLFGQQQSLGFQDRGESMNSKGAIVAVILFMACSVALPSSLSAAQKSAQSRPQVVYDSYHDTSLPVREYSLEVPHGKIPREIEHPRPRQILSGASVPVRDLAEQSTELAPV